MGFSQLVYWNWFPFPVSVDHVLSELFSMTCPSWVPLHGMTHNFIELCNSLHNNKTVIHEGASRDAHNNNFKLYCRTEIPTKQKMLTIWWRIYHSRGHRLPIITWHKMIYSLNKCGPCIAPLGASVLDAGNFQNMLDVWLESRTLASSVWNFGIILTCGMCI